MIITASNQLHIATSIQDLARPARPASPRYTHTHDACAHAKRQAPSAKRPFRLDEEKKGEFLASDGESVCALADDICDDDDENRRNPMGMLVRSATDRARNF